MYGVSILAGIGFTMSLFVSELAFRGQARPDAAAKIGILVGSTASALVGLVMLRLIPSR